MFNTSNLDLKLYAQKKGVPQWKIAVQLGVSENTIQRRLRVPLPAEEEKKIRDAIDQIHKEGVANEE